MFERFTDDARRCVVLAQEAARELRHGYIGTEHLLIGLVRADRGSGQAALHALGVEPGPLVDRVLELVDRGSDAPPSSIPFTPRAKKVLELSLRESLRLGSSEISSGHILLALIDEGAGLAAQALQQRGVDAAAARAAVLADAGGGGEPGPPPEVRPRRVRPAAWGMRRARTQSSAGALDVLDVLDDGAWDALDGARRLARERNGTGIGCTDLLAALATVPGPCTEALRAAGVDCAAVVAAVRATDRGVQEPPPTLPLDDGARTALAAAVGEAAQRQHPAVTMAHVLHGVVVAAAAELEALADQREIDLEVVRREVARRLDMLGP